MKKADVNKEVLETVRAFLESPGSTHQLDIKNVLVPYYVDHWRINYHLVGQTLVLKIKRRAADVPVQEEIKLADYTVKEETDERATRRALTSRPTDRET